MSATMMRSFACGLLLALLAACGQKGDLYLPDGPVAVDVESGEQAEDDDEYE